jgi:hypothetical protein
MTNFLSIGIPFLLRVATQHGNLDHVAPASNRKQIAKRRAASIFHAKRLNDEDFGH